MSTFMTFSVLTFFQDREICCYSVSCKEKDNIDITLQWLISHSKSGGGASAAPTPPPSSASGKGQSHWLLATCKAERNELFKGTQ